MTTLPTLNTAARSLEVQISGDILSTNAAQIRHQVFTAISPDCDGNSQWTVLSVDLRNARMVDSVGLNLLVSLIKELTARDKKLRLLVGSKHILRSMRFTRLDTLAEVVSA